MKVKNMTNEQLILKTLAILLGYIGNQSGYTGDTEYIEEMEKRSRKD